MAEQEPTAGTTPPEGGDAAETPTAGTPEGADRDAGKPSYEELQAMYLESKSAVEERNRLKAQLDQVYSQQPPAAEQGPAEEDLLAGVIEDAKRGDRTAKLALAVTNAIQVLAIEDPAERAEVRQILSANPNVHPQAVLQHVQHKRLKAELDKERAEREKLAATLASERKTRDMNAPDPNVARTDVREATASGTKLPPISRDQFLKRLGTLSDEERMAEMMKARKGQIAVDGY